MFPLHLRRRALRGLLVGAPAQEFRPVAKAPAGEMVELHFDYKLRAQRLPLRGALGAPSTRPPGRLPGETRRPDQFFQLSSQTGPRLSADRRREPNMIKRALVIVETQQ